MQPGNHMTNESPHLPLNNVIDIRLPHYQNKGEPGLANPDTSPYLKKKMLPLGANFLLSQNLTQ